MLRRHGLCVCVALLCVLLLGIAAQQPPALPLCPCNTTETWIALTALYNATAGDQWHNKTGWMVPGSRVCDWYGVRNCEFLALDANGLQGTLPQELMLLTNFTFFNVSGNRLSGTLDPTLSRWSTIETFDVSFNFLTGTLPSEYGLGWPNIVSFSVKRNNFSGSLPSTYANWLKLTVFVCGFNNFSGTLPPGLGAWRQLFRFAVDANNFTGTLPVEYANWSHMMFVTFNENPITGTLPPEYGNWSTETFAGHSTFISGTLPDAYKFWGDRILAFRMRHTLVEGTLPASYKAWVSISLFQANENRLTGSLPPEYAAWSSIASFSVSTNRLTSTIPPAYANWKMLKLLSVHENELSGALPPFLADLPELQIVMANDNKFHGTIPIAWARFRPLVLCTLHNNPALSGEIPAMMPYVMYASVCNTSLCGPKPLMWLHTVFVCQQFTSEMLDVGVTEGTGALTPVPSGLRSCTATTTVAPLNVVKRNSSAAASLPAVAPSVAVTVATAVVMSVVATSLGGAVGVLNLRSGLQVSVHVANFRCDASRPRTSDPIGAAITDNPTGIELSGPLPLTLGTILGNTICMSTIPLLLSALWVAAVAGKDFCRSPSKWFRRVARVSFVSFFGVYGALCVPTAAAAVILIIRGIDGATTFAGLWGVLLSVAPLLGTSATLFVSRTVVVCSPVLDVSRTTKTRRLSTRERLAFFADALCKPKCEWDVKRRASWWTFALLMPLLDSVRSPFQWVVVWDVGCMVLQGILIGASAAAPDSCASTAWAVFVLCSMSCVVALALRPRRTTVDTITDCVMTVWTAVVVLLACLGVGDDEDDSWMDSLATAQAAVQIILSLPGIAWHCHRQIYVLSSAVSCVRSSPGKGAGDCAQEGDTETDRGQATGNRTHRLRVSARNHIPQTNVWLGAHHGVSMQDAEEQLRRLVQLICTTSSRPKSESSGGFSAEKPPQNARRR